MDGDGQLTSFDALVILRSSLGMVQLTVAEYKTADVDLDGDVNSSDALFVLRKSLGLIV